MSADTLEWLSSLHLLHLVFHETNTHSYAGERKLGGGGAQGQPVCSTPRAGGLRAMLKNPKTCDYSAKRGQCLSTLNDSNQYSKSTIYRHQHKTENPPRMFQYHWIILVVHFHNVLQCSAFSSAIGLALHFHRRPCFPGGCNV